MDRDLSLKFVEDEEREIEELCYHISLAHSSALTAAETSSSLVAVTHENMSGTREQREGPPVTIPHEERSGLQAYEESLDIEDFEDQLLVKEEHIMQVLTREYVTHKFIEYIM